MEVAETKHYRAEFTLLCAAFQDFFIEVVPRSDEISLQISGKMTQSQPLSQAELVPSRYPSLRMLQCCQSTDSARVHSAPAIPLEARW